MNTRIFKIVPILGVIIFIIGILGIVFSLKMNTTVITENFKFVHNLGLMNEKQNLLIVFSLLVIVGNLLSLPLFFLRQRQESLFANSSLQPFLGPLDLNDARYVIHLKQRFNIRKDESLDKIFCNDLIFRDVDAALQYADKMYQDNLPQFQANFIKSKASKAKFRIRALLLLSLPFATLFFTIFAVSENEAKHELQAEDILEARLKNAVYDSSKNADKSNSTNSPSWKLVQLDPLTVNFSSEAGLKPYILNITLTVRDKDVSLESKLKPRLPLIRDQIANLGRLYSFDQVSSVEGKISISKDIQLIVNAHIEPELTSIYILQQNISSHVRRMFELGAIPREVMAAPKMTKDTMIVAAQFWSIKDTDLPFVSVLLN